MKDPLLRALDEAAAAIASEAHLRAEINPGRPSAYGLAAAYKRVAETRKLEAAVARTTEAIAALEAARQGGAS